MSIISLLIVLVIVCLVIWSVRAILGAFGIGDPIRTLVYVVLVVVVILYLVSLIGGGAGLGSIRLR